MVDPRRLLTFREVARRRSFSRAGEELALTQPAVSQQVSSLERQLGVRLLDRGPGGPSPTEAGALLLAHADAPCSGAVFAAGGGHFARVALAIGQGHVTADLTPEAVRDAFDTVWDMAGGTFPASTDDATGFVMGRVLGRAAGPGVAALRPATPGRS